MTTDLGRLIEALRRTLNDAVAPELSSDFARGQLAAVHDILGKIAGMAVWDPQALQAQAQALREQLRVERQRIPLTDFSAMTAAAPKD